MSKDKGLYAKAINHLRILGQNKKKYGCILSKKQR